MYTMFANIALRWWTKWETLQDDIRSDERIIIPPQPDPPKKFVWLAAIRNSQVWFKKSLQSNI